MAIPTANPSTINLDDPGRGPMIIAVTWVFTVLALMAVTSWVYVRRKQRIALGWEVWLMIMAMTIRFSQQIRASTMLRYGLGKHDAALTPEQLVMILKFEWTTLPGGTACSVLARASITILLIRLFGIHRKFKWFLIVLISLQIVLSCIFIPVSFVQIKPTRALWDILTPPTSRWDPRIWFYIGYSLLAIWTFSDLMYVLLPVTFIWDLQMPMRRKLGLMFLMCLSLFTMTMSILRTVWTAAASKATRHDVDVQYHSSYLLLFSTLEGTFVIMMGCIPSLRAAMTTKLTGIPSLRSLLSNMAKRRGSKKTSVNSSSVSAKEDGKPVGMMKLGLGGANGESRVIVSTQPRHESQDTLAEDGIIRRTDEWNIVYKNKKESSEEMV